MRLEDLPKYLDNFVSEIVSNSAILSSEIGLSSIDFVQDRVQNTGKDAHGKDFPEYSEGYKKYKQKKGKYNGFTDLTLSSRMWKSMDVVDVGSTQNKVTFSIGAMDSKNDLKMEVNTKRYGTILELSENEIEKIVLVTERKIEDIIKNVFRGA